MKRNQDKSFLSALAVALFGMATGVAWAHCDAENGPVAEDARRALETGELEIVAIWVGEDQHGELRTAFDRCLPVYRIGGEARGLAERHFVETAVRLHREAEGFPYTGLKETQPLPVDVAAAEVALETGNLEPVSKLLQDELEEELTALFDKVRQAQENRDESLAAGREWADSYVKYVIYVHDLYQTIQAGPAHGVGE